MFILSPARLSLHFKVNSRLSSFRFRIELHSMPLQISENFRWRVKLKADLISSLHHRKPPWRHVWMMKKKLYPTCCHLNATLTMLKSKRKSCSFHMYRWEQRWVIIAVKVAVAPRDEFTFLLHWTSIVCTSNFWSIFSRVPSRAYKSCWRTKRRKQLQSAQQALE